MFHADWSRGEHGVEPGCSMRSRPGVHPEPSRSGPGLDTEPNRNALFGTDPEYTRSGHGVEPGNPPQTNYPQKRSWTRKGPGSQPGVLLRSGACHDGRNGTATARRAPTPRGAGDETGILSGTRREAVALSRRQLTPSPSAARRPFRFLPVRRAEQRRVPGGRRGVHGLPGSPPPSRCRRDIRRRARHRVRVGE